MSKLVSIFISGLILLQSFGVHYDDIVQLDELIEHAEFHSDEYGDNMLVFLSKHYGELKADHEKQHQEEKEEHEQLPFNSHSQLTTSYVYLLDTSIVHFASFDFIEFKNSNFYYQRCESSLHKDGILQPPRIS